MKYVKNCDYDYIINKYHRTDKPFDSFNRFIRNDEMFAEDSGLSGEEIINGIIAEDKKNQRLSHSVRKARAFAFVLRNTRISCANKDRFPAINSIDRPLDRTIIGKWRSEVFLNIIPDVEKKREYYELSGIATMRPDYDHSVPVWDRILSLGFSGLLAESEKSKLGKELTEEQKDFYEAIKITYEAIIDFVGRLYALAEKTSGSERLASALKNIQHNPPSTFYEALLVNYLYFMLSEHIEGLQVRSSSHFDRLYYPFYKHDLENGVTEEEIRTDLAYFFMQFTAIGNYWNQPIFLGGTKANGDTEVNELSYLFLDTYNQMGIYNPKIQIKVAENTPKDFVLKALDMIRKGHNCIVFVSDNTLRQALKRAGFTDEQARTCDIKGCYEYSIQGGVMTGMNYVNLLKPLEYALHNGKDGVTGKFVGLQSPDVESFGTFNEFYDEYKRQLLFIIDNIIETVNAYEAYLSYINPQNMLSATYSACIEKGKDALAGGGAFNDTVIAPGFLADIADSLTAIKKYVFDKKEITLKEFKNILDCNYEGHEDFRLQLLNDKDKYGNDKQIPDYFAKDIAEFIVNHVNGIKNAKNRGGKWSCSFHVARQSYIQGKYTAASPNGRRLGEELSKNCSASMGQNKEGPTAAILSVTKIDATSFTGDACLDLGLLPSAVKDEDGLEAMYGLLLTFIKRGGHAMHINVFDADTLRDAQKHPEKYSDLQIRVCGWNVLWNNIAKEEQDGFIKQAEGLA